MTEVEDDREASREKETESRLGDVAPIAKRRHQGPLGTRGRWRKKMKKEEGHLHPQGRASGLSLP